MKNIILIVLFAVNIFQTANAQTGAEIWIPPDSGIWVPTTTGDTFDIAKEYWQTLDEALSKIDSASLDSTTLVAAAILERQALKYASAAKEVEKQRDSYDGDDPLMVLKHIQYSLFMLDYIKATDALLQKAIELHYSVINRKD